MKLIGREGKKMIEPFKDPDEELVRNFLESPDKEWRLWLKRKNKYPLDPVLFSLIYKNKKFRTIPRKHDSGTVDHFERNDTSVVRRPPLSYGSVILPALWLSFENKEHPGSYYIGFIEGEKNVTRFLQGVLEKS